MHTVHREDVRTDVLLEVTADTVTNSMVATPDHRNRWTVNRINRDRIIILLRAFRLCSFGDLLECAHDRYGTSSLCTVCINMIIM